MKDLKELVISEAYALREHATQEERERLDFWRLRPMSDTDCIYGQMTGNCVSPRSMDLLKKCAVPFSESIVDYNSVDGGFHEERLDSNRCFSAIEFYIYQDEAQNESLIEFLRDERDSLTIQDL